MLGDVRAARAMATPTHVMMDPEWSISTEAGKWRGKECFVVGGGPSLELFDFSLLRGHRVICLNRIPMKALLPEPPDYLFVSDMHLWTQYEKWPEFKHRLGSTTLVSQPSAFFEYDIPRGLWYLPDDDPTHMLMDANKLYMFSTVAAPAIAFAWRLGVKRCHLLGIDGYCTKTSSYFWEEKIKDQVTELNNGTYRAEKMVRWNEDLGRLAQWLKDRNADMEVVNVSRRTTIEAFPRAPVERLEEFERGGWPVPIGGDDVVRKVPGQLEGHPGDGVRAEHGEPQPAEGEAGGVQAAPRHDPEEGVRRGAGVGDVAPRARPLRLHGGESTGGGALG